MLLLVRKPGESVIITLEDGREITVTLCDISGGQVRLGFDADKTIVIRREELCDVPK